MTKRLRGALALLLVLAAPAWALDPRRGVDEYTVTGWTMDDGLPHNLVNALAQDGEGFLWIGTWEGAARFNGRRFRAADAGAALQAPLAGVRSVLARADGSLLLGTAQFGILQRSPAGQWSRLGGPELSRLPVSRLWAGPDQSLWIATEDSLYRMQLPDGSLREAGADPLLRHGETHALWFEDDGSVLVGRGGGLLRLHQDRVEDYGLASGLPRMVVRGLLRDAGGSLWAGGSGGVWRLGPRGWRQGLAEPVENMLRDRDGNLWLARSAGGLWRYRDGRMEALDERHGLVARGWTALMEDRDGLLWVGSSAGLFRIADGPVYSIDRARGLGDDYVRAVLQGEAGEVWIGHAAGLDRWTPAGVQPVALLPPGQGNPSVMALAPAADGGVLVGTFAHGVLQVDAAGRRVAPLPVRGPLPLPPAHVRVLLRSGDGSLWIGTGNGLAQWKDGQVLLRLGIEDGLPSSTIRALYETPQGLWIGTTAGIAQRRADGSLRSWGPHEYPATGSFDFLADPDGTLWIASDAGLLRLRGGRFRQYGRAEGLPRDTVMRILDDGAGSLWLSSNHGVFRVERADLEALDEGRLASLPVEVFDRGDGMLSSQCNGGSAPAGWAMTDGRLWFPTARGVAVLDPQLARGHRRSVAPLVFESVLVDGVAQAPAAGYRMDTSARRLVVRYAGLDLRSPGRQVYRYRLAGFDEDWQEAGGQTEVAYTSLPPGRFRFEVQVARSPVEDWSRVSSAAFDLEVAAPFWYRSWVIALCALGLAGLAWLGYRLALARQRRQQRQLQAVVEARTHELRAKNAALEQAGRERDTLVAQLAWQAAHDALTGLPNRRAGDGQLEQAVAVALAAGEPLAVALLDVDHFKQINDRHGHAIGDQVLQAVAAVLAGLAAERGCFAARHGGEEFLLCMPQLELARAVPLLEQLRQRVAAIGVPGADGEVVRCTCSIGVAVLEPGQAVHGLLARADARLLRAKQDGRDRVVASG